MNDKFMRQLKICLDIIDINISHQLEIVNKEEEELPKFNYEFEKSKLPKDMLDSYMSFVGGISYIDKYLIVTVERENIVNEINDIKKYIQEYSHFVENELILNTY